MINPFTASMKLHQLQNKINKLIEQEERVINLNESEMQRAYLGIANVTQDSMREYGKFVSQEKMTHSFFLKELQSLSDKETREVKPNE